MPRAKKKIKMRLRGPGVGSPSRRKKLDLWKENLNKFPKMSTTKNCKTTKSEEKNTFFFKKNYFFGFFHEKEKNAIHLVLTFKEMRIQPELSS